MAMILLLLLSLSLLLLLLIIFWIPVFCVLIYSVSEIPTQLKNGGLRTGIAAPMSDEGVSL